MSTTVSYRDFIHDTAAPAKRPSFFSRLIAAREQEAGIRVNAYLARQSDERLAGLGFAPNQIKQLKAKFANRNYGIA